MYLAADTAAERAGVCLSKRAALIATRKDMFAVAVRRCRGGGSGRRGKRFVHTGVKDISQNAGPKVPTNLHCTELTFLFTSITLY